MELRIPIRPGLVITVAGDFPIRESDWEQFASVLEAMKPGIVKPNGVVGPVETTPS